MQSSFSSRLRELASAFSASVLDAIRGASLEELLSESSGARAGGPSKSPVRRSPAVLAASMPVASRSTAVAAPATAPRRKAGRLARRSTTDIAGALAKIVALLKESPAGLRAEEIRQKLGLQAKELPRPLKEGLEAGTLSKVGQKRATTYFAGGGKKVASPAARGAAANRPVASRATAKRPAKRKPTVAAKTTRRLKTGAR